MTNLLAEREWKVGDKCYALFSEDELWYPAVIKKVSKKVLFFSSLSFQVQGSVYTVQYDVYENEEERIGDEIEEVEVIEGENGDDSNRSQKLHSKNGISKIPLFHLIWLKMSFAQLQGTSKTFGVKTFGES